MGLVRLFYGGLTSLLLVAAPAFLSASAAAKDLQTIEVTGLPFPPYIIKNEGRPTSGIVVDIIREAVKNAGGETKFTITNWARSFTQIKNGKTDAIIPTMKSRDREEFLYFPATPIAVLSQVLITQKNSKLKFDGTMESLRDYQIGRIREARVSPAFDAARESGLIDVKERNTPELLIAAAALSRLNAVAMDRALALWSAQKKNMRRDIRIVRPSLGDVPVYLALSKKRVSKEFAHKVDLALKTMNENGRTLEITKKYLGDDLAALSR